MNNFIKAFILVTIATLPVCAQVLHPSYPLRASGVQQTGPMTNATTYLETLLVPTARVNGITQVKESTSNPLVVTVTGNGALQILIWVEELGWVSPLDGNICVQTNFHFPGQSFSIPIMDFVPVSNLYRFRSGLERYSTDSYVRVDESFFYNNGNYLFSSNAIPGGTNNGAWWYINQKLLYKPTVKTYLWADYSYFNPTVFSVGSTDVGYQNGYSAFNTTFTQRNYYSGERLSRGGDDFTLNYQPFYFYKDGSVLLGNLAGTNSFPPATTNVFNYPPVMNALNALGFFKSNGLAQLFYPSGQKLKEEQQPFVGKVYREDGTETNVLSTIIPFPGGEVGIHADAVSDFIYILQTETSAETQVSHVILHNRFQSKLPSPEIITNDTAQITWTPPESGKSYQLQYTTNLNDWISPSQFLKTSISVEQPLIWTDTNTVTSPQRFYRLLLPAN